jgi:hypothetical protein
MSWIVKLVWQHARCKIKNKKSIHITKTLPTHYKPTYYKTHTLTHTHTLPTPTHKIPIKSLGFKGLILR